MALTSKTKKKGLTKMALSELTQQQEKIIKGIWISSLSTETLLNTPLTGFFILSNPVKDWSMNLRIGTFGLFILKLITYSPNEEALEDTEKCISSLYESISDELANEPELHLIALKGLLKALISRSDQETLRAVLSRIYSDMLKKEKGE